MAESSFLPPAAAPAVEAFRAARVVAQEDEARHASGFYALRSFRRAQRVGRRREEQREKREEQRAEQVGEAGASAAGGGEKREQRID
ncbi:unnamed protein product [Closterium sp. NIES-53]